MICKICGKTAAGVGEKYGAYKKQWFSLCHCEHCRFSFVSNPWLEYEKIYSEQYYNGQGADPKVDYLFELQNPEISIRQYEWRGLLKIVRSLCPLDGDTAWLDYGCGNGGLVRYALKRTESKVVGYEEGWIAAQGRARGIPIVSKEELIGQKGSFDVVTAIEVLEHVEDPLSVLRFVRQLLKPGGVFFYTTGNARPFRNKLKEWGYVVPEIHIAFYEPETLDVALKLAGFLPEAAENPQYAEGWTDVLHYKVLKNLQFRTTTPIERYLPWHWIGKAAESQLSLSAFPIGRAV